MTRRVFFLQINLDAPKQKHLQSIREMRNLSRIFLNTSLLCFTNPYVFPKVVKYHFQLKITGLFGTLLVLSKYSTHDCKFQQNCKQIFLYSRLLYCLLRTKVYTCLVQCTYNQQPRKTFWFKKDSEWSRKKKQLVANVHQCTSIQVIQ